MTSLLLILIYLSFISLGLPDSLLGSAWPTMYGEFGVPVSYAGAISTTISVCTIISSLQSDRLMRKLGTGKVTTISVAMTAVALFGFSISHSYWQLCLWAVPYGLGAGSVDAALNNYVALHYSSRHMSWLHCMWGLGASTGPYIMSYALTGGRGWNMGYRYVALMQITLAVILVLGLPLWKTQGGGASESGAGAVSGQSVPLREVVRIPGAREIITAFFCYCALESTAGLWTSSYLVIKNGMTLERAAGFAGLFYIGITVGRAAGGFLTIKLNDTMMIRLGEGIILIGLALLLLSHADGAAAVGLFLLGVGCAPIYPSIIHSTPKHFGADKSQAMIGLQMACAYIGTSLMPPLFGLIANHISIRLFPVYLLAILLLMLTMYELLIRKAAAV